MAIPLIYNLRSVKARWPSTIVAVMGIAGAVGVFIALLSLARGFQATLVASGSEDNALIVRAGATSEMTSSVLLDSVRIIQDAPGIVRAAEGPLVSPEVVLVAPIPLLSNASAPTLPPPPPLPPPLALRHTMQTAATRIR